MTVQSALYIQEDLLRTTSECRLCPWWALHGLQKTPLSQPATIVVPLYFLVLRQVGVKLALWMMWTLPNRPNLVQDSGAALLVASRQVHLLRSVMQIAAAIFQAHRLQLLIPSSWRFIRTPSLMCVLMSREEMWLLRLAHLVWMGYWLSGMSTMSPHWRVDWVVPIWDSQFRLFDTINEKYNCLYIGSTPDSRVIGVVVFLRGFWLFVDHPPHGSLELWWNKNEE